jgi:uncharacterized membrane protein YkoI
MTSGRLLAGWLILLLAAAPVPATAAHHPRQLVAQNGHADNGGISMDEAVARARQNNKDKVLSVETIRVDGRKVYRIKMLTQDGRVTRTRIDARTGKTL